MEGSANQMLKLDRNWASAIVLCLMVAGCDDLPDLTVSADHKDRCINGKPGIELLHAKISNAGPGSVVLVGDSSKPWVTERPSLPLPKWVRQYQTGNTTTLKPGESVSIPIQVVVPPQPDNAPYNLIVEVDPKRAYDETNENNNQYVIPISSKPCQ
jgi:hypothetical protein